MTRFTPLLLVLLRLAIGWHFFFEGVEKLNNPGWSSAGYLRESTGPLADRFHALAGDPVLDAFTLVEPPVVDDEPPATHKRMPTALDRDWDDYFRRFHRQYQLGQPVPRFPGPHVGAFAATPFADFPAGFSWLTLYLSVSPEAYRTGNHIDVPKDQKELAQKLLQQRKEKMVIWLQGIGPGKSVVKSAYGVSVPVERTPPQRVEEYTRKLKEVSDLEKKSLTTFGPSVNAKLTAAKGEVYKMRGELLADIAQQTLETKKTLRGLLTWEQKKFKDPTEFTLDDDAPELAKGLADAPVVQHPTLKNYLADPPPPSWKDDDWLKSWSRLTWADNLVRYGLLAIGACLILGFFTRSACVLGAFLLLSFYLAMPPFPGLPDNPKAEGHYFYVNKNLIEMLALLALATTCSGRWVGLDGLLQFLNPRRWRRAPAPVKMPLDAGRLTHRPDLSPVQEPLLAGAPTNGSHGHDPSTSSREPTHGH